MALLVLLLATAGRYGYHRDELYFRVLGFHPQWGYVDQPPMTPLLARAAIVVFGDSVGALRVPAALCAVATTLLLAALARELGGSRGAQILAALGALGAFPLIAGHTLVTSSVDMPFWLGVLVLVVRALLHEDRTAWLLAGAVTGVATYDKLLVALLLLCLAAGLVLVGPRRPLHSRAVWTGVLLAALIGAPNIAYQVAHGFPQIAMARSLSAHKGHDARITLVPLQLVMLGPLLVPIWVAGLVALLRRQAWRPLRAIAVAYLLMAAFLLVTGGQPYYTLGLLLTLWTAGCVVAWEWAQRGHARRRSGLLAAAVALDTAVAMVLALPRVPPPTLGSTPIPAINQVARDSVGWPTYVAQVARVWHALPPEEQAHAVIVTGNYGEQGAIARFGPRLGLPDAYSGQNALWGLARPPDGTTTVVLINYADADAWLATRFASCQVRDRLDDEIGVDNEEQGEPVRVCTTPRRPWPSLWGDFHHLD